MVICVGVTIDASKNGVAQEAAQSIRRASKTMTEAEARQILGVTENASWEEIVQVSLRSHSFIFYFFLFFFLVRRTNRICKLMLIPYCFMQRYDNLFERNAKNGSFYLQSKVHRAKECLEATNKPKMEDPS